jgi:hypothetical protein
MNQKQELKARVTAKKMELEARLATLRADAGAAAREERAKIESKLSELKSSMVDGWNDLTEDVASKLNHWLTDDNPDINA